MKLRHFYPLIGFVIPTIVVAYGFVIPHSCIAGWNAQSIGFGTTLLGACAAYYSGVRTAACGGKREGKRNAAT
jgi:ABC-type Fe3+ transport system permease subunit